MAFLFDAREGRAVRSRRAPRPHAREVRGFLLDALDDASLIA
jgi:hypothetical protein